MVDLVENKQNSKDILTLHKSRYSCWCLEKISTSAMFFIICQGVQGLIIGICLSTCQIQGNILHQSLDFRPRRSSKLSFMSLPALSPSLFLSRASKIFSLTSACGPEGLLQLEWLSLNHLGYKGPLEVSCPISCLRQVPLVQVPQGHVQSSYEYIPGWRFRYFCQLLFQYLTTVMVKKSFLTFVRNLFIFQHVSITLVLSLYPL